MVEQSALFKISLIKCVRSCEQNVLFTKDNKKSKTICTLFNHFSLLNSAPFVQQDMHIKAEFM